jgi:DNA polymerase-3 subunit beta
MMETDTHTALLSAACRREDLVSALTTVSRVASSRGGVQVLSGVAIRAEDGSLSFAATDMELSLRVTIDAAVTGGGVAVAPGRLLTDLVRLLPDENVSLTTGGDGAALTVSSGAHTSNLNLYAAEDFPRLPSVELPMHEVDSASLLQTIERVSRAASRDESRPVLTGVLVQFDGPRLVMAATDSYRLAVKEAELSNPGPELDAIIPARALAELSRLAGEGSVRMGASDNHVVFGVGGAWLTTRRIDGQFPNYKQLLPESFEVELDIPRTELLAVVRRAGVVAQRNTPLRLRFADGELTVRAQSQDYGETSESLPVSHTADPLEIGFNADFLREGLESMATDTVRLKLTHPLRPGLLTAPDEAFWYLIMPIRLGGPAG